MKNIMVYLSVFLFLTGCHQNASAVSLGPEKLKQNKQTTTMDKTSMKAQSEKFVYAGLKIGAAFTTENETYQFLPEVYSIVGEGKNDLSSKALALVHQEKSALFLEKKGRFSIYRSTLETENDVMSAKSVQNQTLYPVVLNPRTNNLGIVTGSIKVQLQNMDEAEQIASDFRLTLRKKYAHLSTVFYQTETGQDLIQQINDLNNDARVESAAIEVLENINVPQ
jgi:hypothetical protein